MRLGLSLEHGSEAADARHAETHGLFGVFAGGGDARNSIIAATYAATATRFVRVITRVQLGLEHPITLAEEISVLDNVCNGRTVVLVDTGELESKVAEEELQLLREGLSCRPVRHHGQRWKVPAGLPANENTTESVMVTPKPAQIEVPIWLTGSSAPELARWTGRPVLASDPAQADSKVPVQPAIDGLTGDLAADLDLVLRWVKVGATHLLLRLPAGARADETLISVSRHLVPEAGMPQYPRVVSNVKVPLPWPGPDGVPESD